MSRPRGGRRTKCAGFFGHGFSACGERKTIQWRQRPLAAVGVDPGQTLDHVQTAGARTVARAEWLRAVSEVAPFRTKLQTSLLLLPNSPSPAVSLAPSAAEMGIDELRVCQVWVYSLATRLHACQRAAGGFAVSAGMSDYNSPLKGYDEERWDPGHPRWQEMETCVHVCAERAGTEADVAWRAGPEGTRSVG